MKVKVSDALSDLQSGKMIILVDDEDRENEGDLVMAGQFCQTEDVNFMITHARGLVCVPLEEDRAMKLSLPLMVRKNEEAMHTNFTVTCDLRQGISTGTSAYDRAETIRALADELKVEQDFVSPGHVFPLIAHREGLKVRRGHTEATIELLKQAELVPVGVICELVAPEGTMMRGEDLQQFAQQHELKMLAVDQVVNSAK